MKKINTTSIKRNLSMTFEEGEPYRESEEIIRVVIAKLIKESKTWRDSGRSTGGGRGRQDFGISLEDDYKITKVLPVYWEPWKDISNPLKSSNLVLSDGKNEKGLLRDSIFPKSIVLQKWDGTEGDLNMSKIMKEVRKALK